MPPAHLSKPILIANNTTTKGGIVHEIDGNNRGGASYTTNDINLPPDTERKCI